MTASLKPSPQQAAAELLARRKARKSIVDYARYIEVPGAPSGTVDDDTDTDEDAANDNLAPDPVQTELAEHHVLILEAAQRCIEKRNGRLMVFMPPGSAKSTYGSIVVPSWAMGSRKNFRMIGVSYASDLARKMGRRTRSIVKQDAYRRLFRSHISAESSAADEWALDNGSEYMGGGILSGITGNRADLVVIDDPIKGRQDADSETIRKRTVDEYQESILTRLKPGGSLILIQTRWHEADLAGSILPENYNGESGMILCRDGMEWEVICLAAQCEREDDPLGRKIGEFIWPEWFPSSHWLPFMRLARTWSALYQQRPAPDTGDYFKREWIIEHQRDMKGHVIGMPLVKYMNIYGGSDYAVTNNGGDFTVHMVVGIDSEDRPWLLDLWRKQSDSAEWVESFCDLVLKWKPIGWAEETGQIKSGVGPFLVRRMIERQAYCAREQFSTGGGDKSVRAQSMRGRIAMMGLHVAADAPWLTALINEMMKFPVGTNDDQVDALGLIGQILDKMWSGAKPVAEEPDVVLENVVPGTIIAPKINYGKRK